MIIARTDTAAHVHLARRHVVPETFQGFEEILVAHLSVKVGSSCIQVDGSHGVANDFVLILERSMVLLILPAAAKAVYLVVLPGPEKTVPSHIEKEPGLPEVFGIPRIPGEFDQRHLDLWVAVSTQAFAILLWTKNLANMIRQLDCDVEEASTSSSTMVGNGSLDQVACAVEFMCDRELGPPLGPSLYHVVGGEVTVRLLSIFNLTDRGVNKPLELGIRNTGEGPSRCLQPLVQIRIREPPPSEGCVHLASDTSEVI
jgi:hypothetical protein